MKGYRFRNNIDFFWWSDIFTYNLLYRILSFVTPPIYARVWVSVYVRVCVKRCKWHRAGLILPFVWSKEGAVLLSVLLLPLVSRTPSVFNECTPSLPSLCIIITFIRVNARSFRCKLAKWGLVEWFNWLLLCPYRLGNN